jgi:hypothetical protein
MVLSKVTSVNVYFMRFFYFFGLLNYTVRHTKRSQNFVLKRIVSYKIRGLKLSLPNLRYCFDIFLEVPRKTTKNFRVLVFPVKIETAVLRIEIRVITVSTFSQIVGLPYVV